MFEKVDFTLVEGKKSEKDLVLFSLSTCGFCRRAKAYLDSKEFQYRFIQADELGFEDKASLKQEFKERFKETLHFPTLVINKKNVLIGFIKPHWEMILEGEAP